MPRLQAGYALPVLALLLAISPLLAVGFPMGHDWLFELVRLSQFKSAIADGQLPPYWGGDLYDGYGSPVFIFYAPLFLTLASLCSLLTGAISSGGVMALILLSAIATLSIWLLLREALGREGQAAARIAASMFVLNPYLIGNMLARNANAEYAALCLMPLCLYGLVLIGRKPRAGGLVLAAGLGLTIIAHNLTALVAMALVIGAAVALGRKNSWGATFGGIALGLGLSAFFWIPAMYYKSLVRIDQMMTGKYDFHTQFQGLGECFGYGKFYAAGVVIPIVLICGVIVANSCVRNTNRLLYFALAGSMFFVFMLTRPSQWVWDNLPFMMLYQFPWRMMGPLSMLSSIVAGYCFMRFSEGRPSRTIMIAELVVFGLLAANAAAHLRDARPIPENFAAQLPRLLLSDTIRTNGLAATVRDEYLPKTVTMKNYAGSEPVAINMGIRKNQSSGSYTDLWRAEDTRHMYAATILSDKTDTKAAMIKDTATDISFRADGPATIVVSRWFFPGWACTINDAPCTLTNSAQGTCEISLPAGQHTVSLKLHPPLMRRIAVGISILSLLIWASWLIKKPAKLPV